MIGSTAAQSATSRFKSHTWALMAVILGTHLACFAVLVVQIESRYANAYNTSTMAKATDRFQLVVSRANCGSAGGGV